MIRTVLNVDQEGLNALIQNGSIIDVGTGFQVIQSKQMQLMETGILLFEDTIDGELVRWNPAKERDPRVKGNENAGEHSGFRWSPFYSAAGKYLQEFIKPTIIKTIALIHKQIVGKYDPHAYELSDPRLVEMNTYIRSYISTNFQHSMPRKLTFMMQIVDIIMHLMKEDVYYRARFLDLFNNMPRFEITENESNNIQRWR